MQLFSGVIEQRNLRLKKAALSKLKLPIEVLSGYVGLLSVTVPWRNLTRERVVVTIEDVCLVAVPNSANVGVSSAEGAEARLALLAAELEQRIQVGLQPPFRYLVGSLSSLRWGVSQCFGLNSCLNNLWQWVAERELLRDTDDAPVRSR
jgi:hypothetical protein